MINFLSAITQCYDAERASFCLGMTDAILNITSDITDPIYQAGYQKGKTIQDNEPIKDYYTEWKESQCTSST